MFENIISKIRVFLVDLERFGDHIYRRYTGLPTRKRSEITPSLFLGGQYSNLGLEKLHKQEFTAIVNMREKTAEPQAKEKGLKYLHLPTKDQQAPSMENLQRGVKFITTEIENGGRVYVHCRGGEGRGPSMVIAYLISTGMTFEDALESVRKVRHFIRPTNVQQEQLKEFENILKSANPQK